MGRQAVYLINKKHIIAFEVGEQTGQIARFVEHRTRGEFKAHTQLVGDDMRQGGFAQSRWAMQQHMVECLATLNSCLDKDAEVVNHLFLSGKTGKSIRPEHVFKLLLGLAQFSALGIKIFVHTFLASAGKSKALHLSAQEFFAFLLK